MPANGDCASSRPDRQRRNAASLTRGWAISSTTSSTTCCPHWHRRGGTRSRGRSSSRRLPARGWIRGRSALAVRDSLQLLAAGEPVLVAIDDVQWLDDSSTHALAFALRRLGAEHVLLLLARRLDDRRGPSGLQQALGAESVLRLPVGPLSVGALHRFLRDRLGRPFARQTLLRIHERSGGNPFFALELARVLDADIDPMQPLPVPGDARRARAREDLGAPRLHPRGARARLGGGHDLGGSPAAGGHRGGRARPGGRRARDRARERDDPLHPPAALVGPLPGPRRGAAERARDVSRGSSTTRSSAPDTSRSRGSRRTAASRRSSTTRRDWRRIAARRPPLPSSPSRRSG